MLVCGFLVLFTSYRIYGHFLGGIDGLPPLPEPYWPTRGDSEITIASTTNEVDRKLQMAFGEECEELKRPIKLEVNSKGMVLAAEDCTPENGRLRLSPVSLALFGKKAAGRNFPEITSVRGEVAYLTFDRPVNNLTDLDKRRVVGCELIGKRRNENAPQDPREVGNGILIVHNRSTEGRDDDLSVFIPRGPVYYREFDPKAAQAQPRKPEIWSDDAVELTDLSSKPQPSTIKATGLEIFLTNDPAADRHGTGQPAKKPRPDQATGVERIVLRTGVEMHLFVDSQSGFLNSPKETPGAAKQPALAEKPPAKADRSLIVITTHGPFTYNALKDLAVFDVPASPRGQFPEQVLVNRYLEPDKRDQLICEHLELQFRRRPAAPAESPPAKAEGLEQKNEAKQSKAEGGLEIESAHATGKEVTLTSDAEVLEAHGNDFTYNALTQQTTLKGDPEMWALKEGNEIHARELQITNQKGAQQGTALGPGRIDLLDKQTGKRPLHARWRDRLLTGKDGKYDLLTLIGEAAFLDDEQGQELRADILKVWLEPREAGTPGAAAKPKDPADDRKPRPHHVEAVGQVQAHSRELNIHHTDRLVLWFKDSPPPIPLPAPASGGAAPGHSVSKPAQPEMPGPSPQAIPPAAAPPGPPPAQPLVPIPALGGASKPAAGGKPGETSVKPTRPIDLSARVVEAHILRTGEKNELDQLLTEGRVTVRQEGATPADRGMDIKGDALELTRDPEGGGNRIVVTSSDENLAQLLLDKLLILGPEINIDQVANNASVIGAGAMEMESTKDFQGNELKKPVPIRILWNKSMFFNGTYAEFHGNIQAEQESAHLTCQVLQVELDRPVSLREGQKKEGEPPAKVQKLVCDRSAFVENEQVEDGSLIKYQRLEAPYIVTDNAEGTVRASGPGVVRLHQPGAAEAPGAARPVPAPDDGKVEMKLTRIRYFGSMYANNKTHTATFRQNVEVVYVPTDDRKLEPNVDRLPEGGMYIRSDMLTVYSQEGEKKGNQEMEARGNVVVRANDFTARADVMHYHEAKDQVILKGAKGNLVSLYRRTTPNGPPQESRAETVIYSRKTGQFELIGGRSVQGN
jgi:lipopolysaccharide export system protein LptA